MNVKLLKRTICCVLIGMSVIAIKPIKANAEWKQSSNWWWNSKGNSYSIGWDNINGNWYYFDNYGYMKTGWLQYGDNWYYLNSDGSMAINTTIDGCYLNDSGVWVQNNSSLNNIKNEDNVNVGEKEKSDKNLISVFYKLDGFSIDKMIEGVQSLKSYYGDDISKKTEIESTYGMIIVDITNYRITKEELMIDCDWEKDLKLVKENGQVKLIIK